MAGEKKRRNVAQRAWDAWYNSAPGYVTSNTIRDAGVSLGQGIVDTGQALVGLADIPTGGAASWGMRQLGYNPDEARRIISGGYSEAQQEANRRVEDAEGFGGTIAELARNPNVVANAAVRSIPAMLGGTAAGAGLQRAGFVAARTAPAVAGGIGEGIYNAGAARGQLSQQRLDNGEQWMGGPGGVAEDTARSLGAGLLGAAIGRAGHAATGGRFAPDVDDLFIRGGGARANPILMPGQAAGTGRAGQVAEAVARGAVSEAVPENILNRGIDAAAGRAGRAATAYAADREDARRRRGSNAITPDLIGL